MTESASQALSILRDPSQFDWYVIPILVLVIYVYNVEVGKKNWNLTSKAIPQPQSSGVLPTESRTGNSASTVWITK